MAGKFALVAAVSALAVVGRAISQEPAATPPLPVEKPPYHGKGSHEGTHIPDNSPEMQNVRKAIEALNPEQRKRFSENLWRWSNLSPDQKKSLRDRDEMRKKFIEQEVEAAIKEIGIALDGEQRGLFVKRYGEERRKIEERLWQEMSEKRKPLLRDLIGRLKTEFSTASTPPAPK